MAGRRAPAGRPPAAAAAAAAPPAAGPILVVLAGLAFAVVAGRRRSVAPTVGRRLAIGGQIRLTGRRPPIAIVRLRRADRLRWPAVVDRPVAAPAAAPASTAAPASATVAAVVIITGLPALAFRLRSRAGLAPGLGPFRAGLRGAVDRRPRWLAIDDWLAIDGGRA
jgi:hypothetical protein